MRRIFLSCLLLATIMFVHTYSHSSTLEWLHSSVKSLKGAWISRKPYALVPGLGLREEVWRGENAPQALMDHVPAHVVDISSQCTNPSVRKEWRRMTDDQKQYWISACLVSLPSSGKVLATVNATDSIYVNPPVNKSGSWYDDFSYVHMELNTRIHQTGLFLPWHRYFLWSFERSLEELCGYNGSSPYWNWTQDAADFEHATILGDSDPKKGLGGFGDPARDGVVLDGGFAMLPLTYPIPHTLRREYSPYPYPEEVEHMVGGFQGDFKGFQSYIEEMQGAHMSVHMIIGGDLSGTCLPGAPDTCRPDSDAEWSPNEPLFWLHHAMVDKVWNDWQRAHEDNFWAFEAGTVRDLRTWPRYRVGAPPAMTPQFPLPANGILVGNYTVQDMFNTTANGPLCYVYE